MQTGGHHEATRLGHLLGYTTLTVILTAGAAQSLSGTNTVDSGDIIDGTIGTPDLKTGSVSGSKILDNSVTGADVNESTLKNRVVRARISSAGVLLGGDAVSATKDSTGYYGVTFGFPVTSCDWVANINGFTAGSGTTVYSGQTSVVNTVPGNTVHVYTASAAGASVDSSFAVLGVCP